ncbi:MAG: phosphoglycerate kinase [Lachnospiraceae bacterium]
MQFGINTLDDVNVQNKTVLCRIDINQPVDKEKNQLKSTNRIEACIPTLKELLDKKAKLVLLAHQGSDIEYKNFYTTYPHSIVLSRLLGQEVKFIEDVCGPAALETIKNLQPGEVLLLDNVRFVSEEQTLFEVKLNLTHEEQAKTLLVRKLAPLADVYACDAFAAAHRDQPSLCGFEQLLPSAMGRLFEKEYCVISELMEAPKRPCTFVLGGAKVSDAFLMMDSVLRQAVADKVIVGGLVGNIVLAAAGYDIGEGSLAFIKKANYETYIDAAKIIYEKYKDHIVLPTDLAWVENGVRVEGKLGEVAADATCVDIGHDSSALFANVIMESQTVFVNGPMGIFEQDITEYGTKTIWAALGETQATTVVGGGDSITATEKYELKEQISYICTGGGALIRFLTGDELPVIKALRHATKKFGTGE